MRIAPSHSARWFSLYLGMFFLLAGSLGAGVFHYQGVLTDPDGNPVTGTRNLTFWLYPQAENGASLWKEGHSDVVLDAGHFSVDLGSSVPFGAGIDFSGDLYLQIAVDGQALAPRVKLRSVPKALHAERAATVDSVEDVPIGTVTPSTGSFTSLGASGNVALGTSSNDSVIVSGTLRIASGSPGAGKMLVSDAAGNAAWQTVSAPGLPNRVLQVGEGAQYATIQAAMAAIVDNDADHQYVIKIAPGVYEEAVDLKAYVSLVGSGRGNTLIRAPAGSASTSVIVLDYTGVVGGSGHNTIRDLSLAHLGALPSTQGIYFADAIGVRVANVAITNVGGEAFADGIFCSSSDVTLENVSIRVANSLRSTGVTLSYSGLVADRLEVIANDVDENHPYNMGISLNSSSMW
ncbi:MAG: hypothetical protein HN849_31085, partial [Victivallales bacterium]|nr:hypothetical protein [Victivallales bacterium]